MEYYIAEDGRAYSQRQLDPGSFPAPSFPIREAGFTHGTTRDYMRAAAYGNPAVQFPCLPIVNDEQAVHSVSFGAVVYGPLPPEFAMYGPPVAGYPLFDHAPFDMFTSPPPMPAGVNEDSDDSTVIFRPPSPALSTGSSPSTDAPSPPMTSPAYSSGRPSTSSGSSFGERAYEAETIDEEIEALHEERQVDAFVAKYTTPGKPNCCALCGNQPFGRVCDLRRHIESKHMRNVRQDPPLKRFKCTAEGCEESFSRRDSQIRHVKKFHKGPATRSSARVSRR